MNYEFQFNDYEFDEEGIVKTKNSAWFSLVKYKMGDSLDLNRYELKEGDIIRIGRIYLRLKVIKSQKYEINNTIPSESNKVNNNNNKGTARKNAITNLINCNLTLNTEINLQEM